MKKFFVLYMMPVEEIDKMMKTMTPEEGKKGMEEWSKWMNDNKEKFSDWGSPLGKSKRLTKDGLVDMRNDITGYGVLNADSFEDAQEKLKNHPHMQAPGAYMEILSVTDMSTMMN